MWLPATFFSCSLYYFQDQGWKAAVIHPGGKRQIQEAQAKRPSEDAPLLPLGTETAVSHWKALTPDGTKGNKWIQDACWTTEQLSDAPLILLNETTDNLGKGIQLLGIETINVSTNFCTSNLYSSSKTFTCNTAVVDATAHKYICQVVTDTKTPKYLCSIRLQSYFRFLKCDYT